MDKLFNVSPNVQKNSTNNNNKHKLLKEANQITLKRVIVIGLPHARTC